MTSSFLPCMISPFPLNEIQRQRAVDSLDLRNGLPELAYEDIVLLAATICNAPMALITLIDRDQQHILAATGLERGETRRENAFCAYALLNPAEVMVVENALEDERFENNPFVMGPPHIRFYAGAPIVTNEGYPLGTVCVVDTVARTLTITELNALQALARATARIMQDGYRAIVNERQALGLNLS
jgi:GAF domain-containing protein